MLNESTGTIFGALNARSLGAADVARSFVVPKAYAELCGRGHAVVSGPRGSGKTTLLKMLTGAALEAWKGDDGHHYRAAIDYSGVFVPTDIAWKRWLDRLDDEIAVSSGRLIAEAAVTNTVLRSLVETMLYRTGQAHAAPVAEHRRARLSSDAERALASHLFESWQLPDAKRTLQGLREALGLRHLRVSQLAQAHRMSRLDPETLLQQAPFLSLPFFDASLLGIDAFNAAVGEPGGQWALLFDELELAPRWLFTSLVASLRSRPQQIFLKVAISPHSDHPLMQHGHGCDAPTASDDFQLIDLTYPVKRDGHEFSYRILEQLIRQANADPKPAERLFGRSLFEAPSRIRRSHITAYSKGSRTQKAFLRLEAADPSFKAFLVAKGISTDRLDTYSGAERAAVLRKVAPLVGLRLFFRKAGEQDEMEARSRKTPIVYAGLPSLLELLEGNPRWIVGVCTPLVRSLAAGAPRVERPRQINAVRDAANRFMARLRTVPCPPLPGIDNTEGLAGLAAALGRYLHERAVAGPFDDDPPGSFRLEEDAPASVVAAVGLAVNAGALICIRTQEDDPFLGTLTGRRFRLSYLLAPLYHFPTRLGRDVGLVSVLRGEQREPTLFDDRSAP